MDYRALGRTGLEVGVLAVGTEHLLRQPPETVAEVIGQAIERGVNYFDVVYAFPDYLDALGAAFEGRREGLLLAGHLGSTVKDGQYCRNRSPKACEAVLRDVLERLHTDHVDILHLHNFNSAKEWVTIARPGGVLDLAIRLRQEGRTRFLGISAHDVEVVRRAIESGHVDVVMFPVSLLAHAMPRLGALLDLCAREQIGVVAMKPYAGGRLLRERGMQRVPGYATGGESYKVRFPENITPAQCLGYTLAQVGVSTALTGPRTVEELASSLDGVEAGAADRDFSGLLAAFGRYVEGECVYCNHCLPCPVNIDIAQVNRLLDAAEGGVTVGLRSAYGELAARASACTECGACVVRCPFGVAVTERLRSAVAVYEG
jgi:predicted aldo/keto reductase-like oxidoreductase